MCCHVGTEGWPAKEGGANEWDLNYFLDKFGGNITSDYFFNGKVHITYSMHHRGTISLSSVTCHVPVVASHAELRPRGATDRFLPLAL